MALTKYRKKLKRIFKNWHQLGKNLVVNISNKIKLKLNIIDIPFNNWVKITIDKYKNKRSSLESR